MTGTILAGRYRLDERVASGGMGTVWRGHDQVLDRPVAVKLLNEHLTHDPSAAERFRREALTAAAVSHPNMAGVFDYVVQDDRPGIVMELVEGETLAQRLARSGAMPYEEAIAVATAVLGALDAAHRAGIVHRDVKPGNIILSPGGEVKVTDFGIARVAGESALTRTGSVLASPHYVAPEQLSGEPATPAADLYSTGIVLYEMLAGRRPFEGDTPVAIAMARVSGDPVPLRVLRPGIPPPIEAAVMRALERDPAARHRTAPEFRDALVRALGGQAASAAGRSPVAEPHPTDVLPVPDAETRVIAPGAPDGRRAPPARPPRGRQGIRAMLGWGVLGVALAVLLVGALVAGDRSPAVVRTVRVPALEGLTSAQAEALARGAGLRLAAHTVADPAPAGLVTDTNPEPGTEVRRGSTVEAAVSAGCCEVPDLRGMSLDDARSALQASGLALGEIAEQDDENAPEGTVLDQDPAAGAHLREGRAVGVVLARTPERDRKHGKDRGNGDD